MTRPALLAAILVAGAGLAAFSAAAAEPTLMPGDVLSVSIARFPELNRQAMIGADGAVRVGGGAVVPVTGLTVSEAQAVVAAALQAAMGVEAGSVLVDVAEYRPVIVHGDGRRGAEVPFRPGMTVLQAVAASDGQRPDLDGSLMEALESQRTVGRLTDETDRQARAVALHARLVAERDGQPMPDVNLAGLGVSAARQAEIVGAERRLLDLRSTQFAEQRRNLDLQRTAVQRRVASLEEELTLHRSREDLAKQYLATLEELGSRGLTTENQMRDARTDLVNAQLLVIRIISDQSAAESDLAALDAAASDLEMRRTMDVAQLLSQTETELELARNAVAAARREVGLAEAYGEGAAGDRAAVYVIHRGAGSTGQMLTVAASAELAPGDVLWVGRE